jgi:DNA-binding SARP family transcriptional activator
VDAVIHLRYDRNLFHISQRTYRHVSVLAPFWPSKGRESLPADQIAVLGGFRFWVSGRDALPALPGGSQRLLAFLALRERSVTRTAVAGTLWPEASEDHAHASLRSAISRLTLIAHEAIVVSVHDLRLADQVAVDIRESRALAHRLLNPGDPEGDGDLSDRAIAALSADLLPDWYDDWAVVEAEDWRQLRLHALDALTGRLIAGGRYADATSAALAAVKAEPLRETSHAALIRVYVAEGNRAEALAAFEDYRALLQAEHGLEPSPLIQALVDGLQNL